MIMKKHKHTASRKKNVDDQKQMTKARLIKREFPVRNIESKFQVFPGTNPTESISPSIITSSQINDYEPQNAIHSIKKKY